MTTYDSSRYALVNRWDPMHLKRIDRILPIDSSQRVLEVGCGSGHLTKRLAERGVDVVGIDANPNAPEVAGTDLVVCMYAEDLEYGDETFDTIVAVHSIEHIPQLDRAFAEMSRVLKPGGHALFIYPAEPIMGLYAIPTSMILYGTPLRAREVHCQKLWPAKVRRMTSDLGLVERHREFNLWKSPQFISLFEKAG